MTFDPQEFMNATVDGANDTHYVPIPEGDYTAVVEAVTDPSLTDKGNMFMHVLWSIDSEPLRRQMDREKITIRQTLWLDLNKEGRLDTGKGKNVPLGRIREATGLNGPGFKFPSLVGRPARIKVSQRLDKESQEIFNDVKAVTKL